MSEAEIILDQESKIYLTAEGYSALKAELAKLRIGKGGRKVEAGDS